MNIDEAMAYAKRVERGQLLAFKYEVVIHTLSDEVERLQTELAAAKAELEDIHRENEWRNG